MPAAGDSLITAAATLNRYAPRWSAKNRPGFYWYNTDDAMWVCQRPSLPISEIEPPTSGRPPPSDFRPPSLPVRKEIVSSMVGNELMHFAHTLLIASNINGTIVICKWTRYGEMPRPRRGGPTRRQTGHQGLVWGKTRRFIRKMDVDNHYIQIQALNENYALEPVVPKLLLITDRRNL